MTFNAADFDRAQRNEARGLPAIVDLAPMWRRVIAQVIDQFVVIVPVALITIVLGVRTVDDLGDKAFAVNVSLVAVAFVYEFVLIGLFGRTAGKFAMGTRTVRVDTAAAVLWSAAAIRALVPLAAGVIPGIGPFLSVAVYATAFVDRRQQGLHDKAAGTIVVMNATADVSR